MSKFIHFLIMLTPLLTGCWGDADKNIRVVPLAGILSDYESYMGEKVVTVGYLGRGEDIFLTSEHAEIDDTSSSVAIYLDQGEKLTLRNSICKNQFIEIHGEFGVVKYPNISQRIGFEKVFEIKLQDSKRSCFNNNDAGK